MDTLVGETKHLRGKDMIMSLKLLYSARSGTCPKVGHLCSGAQFSKRGINRNSMALVTSEKVHTLSETLVT